MKYQHLVSLALAAALLTGCGGTQSSPSAAADQSSDSSRSTPARWRRPLRQTASRPVHAGKERFGRVGEGSGAVHFRPCAAAGTSDSPDAGPTSTMS
ncbi:MAG: hypothetical protein ACLVJH_06925 [Faecalibacterium prausnitzii]